MAIPVFTYYVASSADGFIADSSGGVGWLAPFFGVDYGFHGFLSAIDTVVLGRRTYEHVLKLSQENPYQGKRFIVLSRTRAAGPHAELFWPGPLDELAARLRTMGSKSVWVVGGGAAAASFLAAGWLDEVRQHVMPVLLGSGTPLFSPLEHPVSLELEETKPFPNGVVHLRYRPKRNSR